MLIIMIHLYSFANQKSYACGISRHKSQIICQFDEISYELIRHINNVIYYSSEQHLMLFKCNMLQYNRIFVYVL